MQQRFRERRFIPLDPPDNQDHEGTEILLVRARQDVYEALGLQLNPEHKAEATAEIFNELRMEKLLHPITLLFEGKWE